MQCIKGFSSTETSLLEQGPEQRADHLESPGSSAGGTGVPAVEHQPNKHGGHPDSLGKVGKVRLSAWASHAFSLRAVLLHLSTLSNKTNEDGI